MLNHYSKHRHERQNIVAVTGDFYYKLSDGIATPAGKSEFCIHTQEIPNDCSVLTFTPFLLRQTQRISSTPFQQMKSSAREGGLRIWTAQETECVLEVG